MSNDDLSEPTLASPAAPPGTLFEAPRVSPGWLMVELAILLPVAGVWFFYGTARGDFIGTEALRAIVVREMLNHDSWLLPTVHERVYLRKPPLYAWTTAALATVAGRFDEQVARWPSAAMGVLYLVALYLAGKFLIDSRAGPAAAVIGGSCWLVLDYGMRADLDAGVLAWTSVAGLLLGGAWLSGGRRRVGLMIAAYLAALAGSFWKAPHVLLTLWFMLAGLIWLNRGAVRRAAWRFALCRTQVICALASMIPLGLWFGVLARSVGSGRTGKFILLEFLARVVPHSVGHITELILAPPKLVWACLPASLFAGIWLVHSARRRLDDQHRIVFNLLLAWLLPNLIFLLFVPAKASRYWLTIFAPVALLAALAWRRYQAGELGRDGERVCGILLRAILIVGAVLGAGLAVSGAVVLIGAIELPGDVRSVAVLLVMAGGVLAAVASLLALRRKAYAQPARLGVPLIVLLMVWKMTQVEVILPVRSELMSPRSTAEAIERALPPGVPLFTLSDTPGSDRSGELADLGYYCRHEIHWPENVDLALEQIGPDAPCFLILRAEARDRIMERFGDQVHAVDTFAWADDTLHLMRLAPAAAGPDAGQP